MNAERCKSDNGECSEVELSIVMPCLNEAETLKICIQKAQGFLNEHSVIGEIVVADNGSHDGSQQIARDNGAELVNVEAKGYGSALYAGINASKGKYVIMGDSDDSYDFSNLMPFLEQLRNGYDLVMGNRFKGGIEPGAMPKLHYYVGNPVLTAIGRILYASDNRDFHCGLRGFTREAFDKMNLHCTGMEFASEIVIKAHLDNMKVTEVPTTLSQDGRSHPPHLRSFRDGWRHLRFMLLYCPKWVFYYPGLITVLFSVIASIVLTITPVSIGSVGLDINTLLITVALSILGYQAVWLALFAGEAFAGLGVPSQKYLKLPSIQSGSRLEIGCVIGFCMMALGILGGAYATFLWGREFGFGSLNPQESLRLIIPSVGLSILGGQTVMGCLFVGVLDLVVNQVSIPKQKKV